MRFVWESNLPILPLKNSIAEHDFGADPSVYALIGGRPCLERVHKALYNKIYTHPAFKAFFENTDQTRVENQQSDFMAMALGGPSINGGQPDDARQNLFITEKTFELRHQILAETLKECRVPEEPRTLWLAADRKFYKNFTEETIDDCEQRFNTGTF